MIKIENILNLKPVPGPAPAEPVQVPITNNRELITSTPTAQDFDELNRIYSGLDSENPAYIIIVGKIA
jgi:hypothetical protein